MKLVPVDSIHIELLRRWRNDHAIWRWSRQNDLISDVSQRAWFERVSKDTTTRMYCVELTLHGEKAEKYLVGACSLSAIDFAHRHAEFSIYIDPAAQGRGNGKRALSLLLAHGFQNLGLHQIWGETFEGNHAAKMFESLGFRHDGTRRQFYWKDGKMIDSHLVSILREEWLATSQQSSSASPSSPPSPPSSSQPPSTPKRSRKKSSNLAAL
jgi:RimJ/RimL family protein N-acetyltransferase